MKKIFVFTLVLSLLLVGCKKAETPETTAATETVNTENNAVEMKRRPLVAVALPTTTEEETNEFGTVIFEMSTQHIKLTMADADVAEKVSLDFFNRINTYNANSEQIRQSAISEFANDEARNIPYEYAICFEPQRIDQGVLSLFGTEMTYMGGAHPSVSCVSVNYDLITGDVLTLGSILTHENALPSLKALVLVELNEFKDALFDDYKDTINKRFEGEESYDEDWFFTNTGLCFYFSPYEIGPYASGTIVAEIPYDELTGIIADEFFPAEQEVADGDIDITAYEDAVLGSDAEIAELVLDPEGDSYIVQTDSGVQDVVIIYNNSRVFAMQQLTKEDAIRIQVDPDTAHQLTILYTTGNTPTGKPLI